MGAGHNSALASRLERIAGELQRVAEELRGNVEVQLTPEVAEKLRRRTCLQCGSTIEGASSRGLCDPCYHATKHRMRKGLVTEQELIDQGLFAPPGVGLRRPLPETKLGQMLREKEELAAEQVAKRLVKEARSRQAGSKRKT